MHAALSLAETEQGRGGDEEEEEEGEEREMLCYVSATKLTGNEHLLWLQD